jgi:hypothetical protein
MNKLTKQQRRVLDTPRVKLLGYDEAGKPVVEGMTGIPHQLRRWALKADGDPLDITGKVSNPLDEWFEAIARGEDCPACGAKFKLTPKVGKGAKTMTHLVGCAYIRLLDAESDDDSER